MPWIVDADPINPDRAVTWFRARLPLTDPAYRAISDTARQRAFFIAGLAQLDLVQGVMDALDAGLAEGETFEQFKARLSDRLQRSWGGQSAHRLQNIFDTNLQLAYGAGRWKAADELRAERPYWGLAVVLDGRTSKICLNLRGVVRAAEDPFWDSHIPPLHFRCRTALVTFSVQQAENRVTQTLPDQPPLEGFGRPPGREAWSPRPEDYHPALWAAYERNSRDAAPGVREERIRRGVQYQEGVSRLSKSETEEVLRGLNQAGLTEYLKTRPLTELSFKPLPQPRKGFLAGQYDEIEQRLTVHSSRPSDTYRQDFRPIKLAAFSETAIDAIQAIKYSMVHEVGHHILGDLRLRSGWLGRIEQAFAKGGRISQRAAYDWEEYFCECFVAFMFNPGALRVFDPDGHAMIRAAREELKLL